ncbi:MAG: hypothetical protein KDB60_03285 [Propionibacteriaceae bacterium]|nr:hypothetical protein [Propionibacteriaceae bacterium]
MEPRWGISGGNSAYESATGRAFTVRHVPRWVLGLGSRVLARIRPTLASAMGMALYFDTQPSTWDDTALRAIGIEPRAATAFIRQQVAAPAT